MKMKKPYRLESNECRLAGVEVFELDSIGDERGKVSYGWSAKDANLGIAAWGFPMVLREVYFSTVSPRVFKGWHLHLHNSVNYVAVVGLIKVYMADLRPESPTFGEYDYINLFPFNRMLHIPPLVWNGFISVDAYEPATVANLMDQVYDEGEMVRRHPSALPIRIPSLAETYDLAG
jgi:dTDP-4-dehydrorhamnose 3,5-epimerase-like enzyme